VGNFILFRPHAATQTQHNTLSSICLLTRKTLLDSAIILLVWDLTLGYIEPRLVQPGLIL